MHAVESKALLGLDLEQFGELLARSAEPSYRARQMFEAVYRQRVESVQQISTLSQDLRQSLSAQGFEVGLPRVDKKFESSDGTIRYLLGLADGETVETVWMPEGDQGEAGDGSGEDALDGFSPPQRATICVSSQVGCAVNCQFCLTALLGVKRNLTAGEIVGQVCCVLRERKLGPGHVRINLVFMGMGEPFLNYANFVKAVRLLVDGVEIPPSRMTVSTSGIVPRIYDLGREAVRPKLAISLNATSDQLRDRLMPINRKWNLEKLLAAAREFPLRPREKITFEYVLLDQVNDSIAEARELAGLIRGIRAKVNLIALNPGPGIEFRTPDEARVARFQNCLIEEGVAAFLRRPRGRDIYAACGQLKGTFELAPSV